MSNKKLEKLFVDLQNAQITEIEEPIASINTNFNALCITPRKNKAKERHILAEIERTKTYNKTLATNRRKLNYWEKQRVKSIKKDNYSSLMKALSNIEIIKPLLYKAKPEPLKYLRNELSKSRGEPPRLFFHCTAGNFSINSKYFKGLKNQATYILHRTKTRLNKAKNKAYDKIIFATPEDKIKLNNQIDGLDSLIQSIDINIEAIKRGVSVKQIDETAYEIFYSYDPIMQDTIDILIVGGGKGRKKTKKEIEPRNIDLSNLKL